MEEDENKKDIPVIGEEGNPEGNPNEPETGEDVDEGNSEKPDEPGNENPDTGEENPDENPEEKPEEPEEPEEKPNLYRSAIRTVTIIFGKLFNNIYIRKYNQDGSIPKETRKVPITFSPKEQYYVWLSNTMRRPDSGTKVGIRLPRLSYELTGLAPDAQRQINPYLYNNGKPVPDITSPFAYRVQSPAAYSFNFTLSLWASDMESSIQVLENILPYFKPEISVKVQEQDIIPVVNDVHIVFNGISKQDNYSEGFEVNRFIQWDMDFTMYSNIWAPSVSGNIVTEVTVDINDGNMVQTLDPESSQEICFYN